MPSLQKSRHRIHTQIQQFLLHRRQSRLRLISRFLWGRDQRSIRQKIPQLLPMETSLQQQNNLVQLTFRFYGRLGAIGGGKGWAIGILEENHWQLSKRLVEPS
jgi:hypothetical protein